MAQPCHNCGFDNPPGARFCGDCGVAQLTTCATCDHENPLSFKFCTHCGTALAGTKGDLRKPEALHLASPATTGIGAALASVYGAERRHLTVLFCDIVGSTKLSQELDIEDYRALMRRYESACADTVTEHGGFVAQFLGDGLLAYFGYPRAAEDDAARAVRAGLDLVARIHKLDRDRALSVRVGIHAGQVVIGDDPGQAHRRDNTAIGETPNIAARIQNLAKPDEVMISDAALRLLKNRFSVEDRGAHNLKGVNHPLTLYRVIGQQHESGWFAEQESGVVAPFVGREQELAVVTERWRRARDGKGQVVLLSGENGIGKSRLIRVGRDMIMDDEHSLLRHYCSPYQQNRPFHPFIDALDRALDLIACETIDEKRERLEQVLRSRELPLATYLPPLAALLSIPIPAGKDGGLKIPTATKDQTIDALFALLHSHCMRISVIFVLEDIHWADPSTLEFVGRLLDPLPSLPILLVLSHRPEFVPTWRIRDYGVALMLDRLSDDYVVRMINGIAGHKRLPQEVVDTICQRADGVPLFVEETTKMILSSPAMEETESAWKLTGPLPASAVPETLQDSLMARLDRLGPAKEIAQLAATIGRRFTYPLIVRVADLPEAQVAAALNKLVESNLVQQRGLPPHAGYMFRQTLIQDIAYDSLLRSQRQAYHARIAEVLESDFPDVAAMEPDLMARHLSMAGRAADAINYCLQAADQTLRSSAISETLGHIETALTMLETVPPGDQRDRQELRIWLARGPALLAREGYSSVGAYESFQKALPLAERIGTAEDRAKALLGQFAAHYTIGRLEQMQAAADKLMALAADADDTVKVPAYLAMGTTCTDFAQYHEAREHYQAALDLVDRIDGDGYSLIYAQDIGVMCLTALSFSEWLLGAPSRAYQRIDQAIARAESLDHPLSLAFALTVSANTLAYMGQWDAVDRHITRNAEIAREHGFESWALFSEIYLALAAAHQGDKPTAERRLARALARAETIWKAGPSTQVRAIFAEIYLTINQPDNALEQAELGLKRAAAKGGRGLVPELDRLAALALLALGKPEAAHNRAERALGLAQERRHVMFALRAAVSLAEIDGAANAVTDLIKDLLANFDATESCPDLDNARALVAGRTVKTTA